MSNDDVFSDMHYACAWTKIISPNINTFRITLVIAGVMREGETKHVERDWQKLL